MAAVVPHTAENGVEPTEYDTGGSDLDAEGEDDVEIDYSIAHPPAVAPAEEGEMLDGEGQEQQIEDDAREAEVDDQDDDDEDEEDEEDFVGAVKLPNGRTGESDEEEAILEEVSEMGEASIENGDEEEDEEEDNDSDKSSSSEESVAAEEWEGGSDGADEGEAEVANRNNCM